MGLFIKGRKLTIFKDDYSTLCLTFECVEKLYQQSELIKNNCSHAAIDIIPSYNEAHRQFYYLVGHTVTEDERSIVSPSERYIQDIAQQILLHIKPIFPFEVILSTSGEDFFSLE